MNIRNLMEDIVMETVEEIYQVKAESLGLTDCTQCRLDVACYVLNRVKPEYIVSGRGLVHMETNYQNRLQEKADLVAIVNEGFRKISENRRPHYGVTQEPGTSAMDIEGPVFNFPAIIGQVLNGSTFEPVSDISVTLLREGKPVEMVDNTWQNPYHIAESTKGNYTFWPVPVKAEKENEERIFCFEVRLEDDRYEQSSHFLELKSISSRIIHSSFSMDKTFKTEKFFVFLL